MLVLIPVPTLRLTSVASLVMARMFARATSPTWTKS